MPYKLQYDNAMNILRDYRVWYSRPSFDLVEDVFALYRPVYEITERKTVNCHIHTQFNDFLFYECCYLINYIKTIATQNNCLIDFELKKENELGTKENNSTVFTFKSVRRTERRLESVFAKDFSIQDTCDEISRLRRYFYSLDHVFDIFKDIQLEIHKSVGRIDALAADYGGASNGISYWWK